MNQDLQLELQQQVHDAIAAHTPLSITGSGSKSFLGRRSQGDILSIKNHRGIISYEPTELVLTARAGTPLKEVEATLAEQQQVLAFEPPHYGSEATLGGTIAAGLSGPRRPFAGAARDFVLGTGIINGKGEIINFGGQVMKNVAGYDVSRLMTGAMGTLGVVLQISLKVLPRTPTECSLCFDEDLSAALIRMDAWSGQPLPVSAMTWHQGQLYIRLSGTEAGVQSARQIMGGQLLTDGESFWAKLREQQLDFFNTTEPLWRLSVPANTPALELPGPTLIEWGGALRWLKSEIDSDTVRAITAAAGGHAMLYRNGDQNGEIYHPLDAGLLHLEQRVKAAFDPLGIFNPGRLYAQI